ncbi:MAG: MBL fold metallo-hydrolase [Chloroflexota bacterium]
MPQKHEIHTLDLLFQGLPGVIAAYLIPHAHGAVLIESGPGSTIPALEQSLAQYGFTPENITDVLLTHIHLDHAGAAGWLAQQGAHIHVHQVGAPHLIDPRKLLVSAKRIYLENMDRLWGEFLPVPEDKLHILQANDIIEIEGLVFKALDTPGHAYHHMAYLFEGTCFSGDVGGIRLAGPRFLLLPTPPPELDFGKWRQSLQLLKTTEIMNFAPTHFGIQDGPDWHLHSLSRAIDDFEDWMESNINLTVTKEENRAHFSEWTRSTFENIGMSEAEIANYELGMPSWMSADGMTRCWKKIHTRRK